MAEPDVNSLDPGVTDDDLVEAGLFRNEAEASAHGLVILAAGRPYWTEASGTDVRLLVERSHAGTLLPQLAAFRRESGRWPPPPVTDPWIPRRLDLVSPLAWAVAVLGIFRWSQLHPGWGDSAVLDAEAVWHRGEAGRAATALFLHADAGHVIANALGGLLVFSVLIATFGRMRGWLLLAAASIAGNLLVSAIHLPGPYRSVGASTAIFAAVGLLTGRSVLLAWRSSHPHRWRAMFIPLAAGLTVLALHGAGGQRVDVGAHLTGFIAGAIAGFAAGLPRRRQHLP